MGTCNRAARARCGRATAARCGAAPTLRLRVPCTKEPGHLHRRARTPGRAQRTAPRGGVEARAEAQKSHVPSRLPRGGPHAMRTRGVRHSGDAARPGYCDRCTWILIAIPNCHAAASKAFVGSGRRRAGDNWQSSARACQCPGHTGWALTEVYGLGAVIWHVCHQAWRGEGRWCAPLLAGRLATCSRLSAPSSMQNGH